MLDKVDALPTDGPDWVCDFVNVYGDVLDDQGNPVIEEVQLWQRDPVECIRELLSNPAFKTLIKYAPEKVYRDADGNVRVFGEAWSADWWWNLQVRSYQCFSDLYGGEPNPSLCHRSRKFCRRVLPLHLLSFLRTKPNSHSSKETRAHGQSI